MFFYPSPQEGKLPVEESHHAVRVLRHSEGDQIRAFDGEGKIFELEIVEANSKACKVKVLKEEIFPTPKPAIEVAVAPPKSSDRLGFMIEKLVEVGVAEITILETKHSERRKINLEKLNKIALSAAKQCGTPFLPLIDGPAPFTTWASENQFDQKLIATAELAGSSAAKMVDVLKQDSRSIAIAIGPEGDFNEEELDWAKTYSFTPVSLGRNVLRTETAAMAAAVILNDHFYT